MMLVERGDEIDLLTRLLAADAAGGVALVRGITGCGKTELLRELAAYAENNKILSLVAASSADEREIPLGVLFQLLHSAPAGSGLLDEARVRLSALVSDVDFTAGPAARVSASALTLAHDLAGTLSRIAGPARVLITVDDVDLADFASLNCLLHLAKKLSGTRVTMVLTMSSLTPPTHPLLQSEPIGSKTWHRLTLTGLSEAGIAQLLAGRTDARSNVDTACALHRATGGNPRLVRALIDDSPAGMAEVVAGSSYRNAVTACLRRTDQHTAEIAEAAATLAASDSLAAASPVLIARMVNTDPETVRTSLATLDAIGITDRAGTVFRHPAARVAVLAGTSRERREWLHGRAARQLHVEDSAVSPARVAFHLLAAGETSGPPADDVLVRAGAMLTAAKDFDLATRCLELAMASVTTERKRASIRMALARTEMRVNPAAAKRHIGPLLDAYKNDQLDDHDGSTLLAHLVWHGQLDEAANVIEWTANGNVSHAMHEFTSTCRLLLTTYPRLVPGFEPPRSAVLGVRPASIQVGLRTQSANLLQRVLTEGAGRATTEGALRVLSTLHLSDETIDVADAALETLVFGGQAAKAATACAHLMEEAVERDVPLWEGVLSSVRAEIATRQGHLRVAKDYSIRALDALPAHGWGAASGRALGSVILAATRLDELDVAAGHLQWSLPDAMFASRHGAQYLYARGQFYLAAQHFDAALADFEFCGRLLREWGMDSPAFVPWRSGAAAVRLRMKNPGEAERLLRDQLDLVDTVAAGCPRTRGMSLLLLGYVRTASQRVLVLREAIKLLRASGDVFLLSRAMLALSKTHSKLGERDKARVLNYSATKLSRTIQASAGKPRATTKSPGRHAHASELKVPATVRGGLTESEQRVAVLAATGHTNREIADSLYITVSTVEQHLTSAYRKLDVKKRTDLPVELLLD